MRHSVAGPRVLLPRVTIERLHMKLQRILYEAVNRPDLLKESATEERDFNTLANDMFDVLAYDMRDLDVKFWVQGTLFRKSSPMVLRVQGRDIIEALPMSVPNTLIWMGPLLTEMEIVFLPDDRNGGSYNDSFNQLTLNVDTNDMLFDEWFENISDNRLDHMLENVMRRTFVHELRHVYQMARADIDFATAQYTDATDNYDAYLNHPLEVDAKIAEVISVLESKWLSRGELPPNIPNFVSVVLTHQWPLMTDENQRKILKRVGRYAAANR